MQANGKNLRFRNDKIAMSANIEEGANMKVNMKTTRNKGLFWSYTSFGIKEDAAKLVNKSWTGAVRTSPNCTQVTRGAANFVACNEEAKLPKKHPKMRDLQNVLKHSTKDHTERET